MIELRKLKIEDAPLMLEWMHNEDLVKYMRADFKSKTLKDCQNFIEVSQLDKCNIHFAAVDSDDNYMGTVSLKNVDKKNNTAEFAICMRKCALGTGMSLEAMRKILKDAFLVMKLDFVYWSVNPMSKRAVRFYEKNGFHRQKELENDYKKIILSAGSYGRDDMEKYWWYIEQNQGK